MARIIIIDHIINMMKKHFLIFVLSFFFVIVVVVVAMVRFVYVGFCITNVHRRNGISVDFMQRDDAHFSVKEQTKLS